MGLKHEPPLGLTPNPACPGREQPNHTGNTPAHERPVLRDPKSGHVIFHPSYEGWLPPEPMHPWFKVALELVVLGLALALLCFIFAHVPNERPV